ncbi:MAG: hypothetical protein ACI8PT_000534 [Gammaproteobacteria bacterium]
MCAVGDVPCADAGNGYQPPALAAALGYRACAGALDLIAGDVGQCPYPLVNTPGQDARRRVNMASEHRTMHEQYSEDLLRVRARALPRLRRVGFGCRMFAAICLIGWLIGATSVRTSVAAEVEGLYVAEIPVASKDAAQREGALAKALFEVLVKVTGSAGAAKHPQIREAATRSAEYLRQYRYETVMREGPGGVPVPILVLVGEFDPKSVNELVRSVGLPMWSRIRPTMLIWLAGEGGVQPGPALLGPADSPALIEAASAAAQRRGLPIVLPLLDLQDRAAAKVADVWAGRAQALAGASARYEPEAILLGRLSNSGAAAWSGQWTLLLNGVTQSWANNAQSGQAAIDAGIGGATDRVATRFAQRNVGVRGVQVRVLGVVGVEDYVRTLAYLESLDLVSRVSVVAAERDMLSVAVQVRGGNSALMQMVELGGTLVPSPGAAFPGTFRLVPR